MNPSKDGPANGVVAESMARARPIRLTLARRDGHRQYTLIATILALVGVVMAAAMAVFGLPPFSLSGPLHDLGLICPLCGGTRSARLTAQGNLAEAWNYNPLGIVAVLGAAATVMRTTFGWTTRRWLNVQWSLSPKQRRALLILAIAMLVLLEIRQIQRADLLTSS